MYINVTTLYYFVRDIHYFIAFSVLVVLIVLALSAYYNLHTQSEELITQEFAKCLSEKRVVMYGASWCPHCNNQKKMFGENWKYVNYVECSTASGIGQSKQCDEAGITAYPTWEFSDGTRKQGELTPSQISKLSGCALS